MEAGLEALDWVRALAALIATLALVAAAAYVARRFGLTALGGISHPGAARRLAVKERLSLDTRRALVLVAVDGREHLLLLSPFGDRVVERAPEQRA